MAGKNTREADLWQEELFADLTLKAALDADAAVRLIEALEEVLAGRDAHGALTSAGLTESMQALPGKSPAELAGEAAAIRELTGGLTGMAKIVALRDSLYRYQSFIR